MKGRASRFNTLDVIVLVLGLLITLCLPYRATLFEDDPMGSALVIGPILLCALAASVATRHRKPGPDLASPRPLIGPRVSRAVMAAGLPMLLVGGFPWLYTPQFFHGETNSSSGLIGTLIFLTIGLPGLIITTIGIVNLRGNRRARDAPKDPPGVTAEP